MQKRYLIKLAGPDEKVKVVKDRPEQSLREIEIDALELLFQVAAQNETSKKKIFSALDSADRVVNLTDNEDFILDDEDLGFIDAGLQKSAGGRPFQWTQCKNLFRQLDKPEEYETPEADNAENP